MDALEQLRDEVQDAEHAVTDAERFAGNAVQYAKDRNFSMFNATISNAISMAEALPHRLRSLQRFVEQHSDLENGGF